MLSGGPGPWAAGLCFSADLVFDASPGVFSDVVRLLRARVPAAPFTVEMRTNRLSALIRGRRIDSAGTVRKDLPPVRRGALQE